MWRCATRRQGLGKTITGLALVLKSRGRLPAPPPGARVVHLPPHEGRPAAYYTLPMAAAAAQQPGHRGRRASLRGAPSGASRTLVAIARALQRRATAMPQRRLRRRMRGMKRLRAAGFARTVLATQRRGSDGPAGHFPVSVEGASGP